MTKIDTLVCTGLAKFKLGSLLLIILGGVCPMAEPAEVREALLQALDDGLSVPGETVKAAIYEQGDGEADRQEPLPPAGIELYRTCELEYS
jgi:hypothetical protein